MRLAKLMGARERFCVEFVKDFNVKLAADRAFFKRCPSNILTLPDIRKRISELLTLGDSGGAALPGRVLGELISIAFSRVTDIVRVSPSMSEGGADELVFTDFDSLPEDTLAAIAYVRMGTRGIELRMHDKLRALYYLGLCHGLFSGVPPEQEGQVTIVDDL